MLYRLTEEPVLRVLMARMKNDEIYHYKNFFDCYLRYRQTSSRRLALCLKRYANRFPKLTAKMPLLLLSMSLNNAFLTDRLLLTTTDYSVTTSWVSRSAIFRTTWLHRCFCDR